MLFVNFCFYDGLCLGAVQRLQQVPGVQRPAVDQRHRRQGEAPPLKDDEHRGEEEEVQPDGGEGEGGDEGGGILEGV